MDIQYCVILSEGADKGFKNYIWASKQEIRNVIGEIQNRSPFFKGEELCYKGEDYEVRFKPLQVGSLVIKAKDLTLGKSIFLDLSEGPYDRV